MLDKTEKKLRSYFNNEPQMGADGQPHEMDGLTKINRAQCEALAELHARVKPDLSVEAGLAYGFSTLPMLDSMEAHGYGHHIAIDPSQRTYWHGIALTSIEQLEFSNRFTWLETNSDRALIEMINENKRVQFVYLDGLHSFDGVLADFFLANQILDVGGVVVFNQKWMPVGRAIASFVESNLSHYESVGLEDEIMFGFRKVDEDRRNWDHFVPFDGTGGQEKKRSFLRNILGG